MCGGGDYGAVITVKMKVVGECQPLAVNSYMFKLSLTAKNINPPIPKMPIIT